MTYQSNSPLSKRPSRVWPLLAALWVAVGLSPCVLAAVGDLDCLHCPDEATASGHDGHANNADQASHAHHAAMGHDMERDARGAGDCGDDCLDGSESAVDARGFKLSPKDGADSIALPAVEIDAANLYVPATTCGLDPPAVVPIPRERLHAIHCVYLD